MPGLWKECPSPRLKEYRTDGTLGRAWTDVHYQIMLSGKIILNSES